jgi:hypothetical protein
MLLDQIDAVLEGFATGDQDPIGRSRINGSREKIIRGRGHSRTFGARPILKLAQ